MGLQWPKNPHFFLCHSFNDAWNQDLMQPIISNVYTPLKFLDFNILAMFSVSRDVAGFCQLDLDATRYNMKSNRVIILYLYGSVLLNMKTFSPLFPTELYPACSTNKHFYNYRFTHMKSLHMILGETITWFYHTFLSGCIG